MLLMYTSPESSKAKHITGAQHILPELYPEDFYMKVKGGWYVTDTWYKEKFILKLFANTCTHKQVKIKFHTKVEAVHP